MTYPGTDVKPSAEATVVARLRKRIARLTTQRDYFSQRCANYATVLGYHPYIERTFNDYQAQRREHERVRGLEQRIKEQAALIELLQRSAP